MSEIVVRAARPGDAPGMARVHVRSWQETYRGMLPDERLDAPDLVERRERQWDRSLADPVLRGRIAVAELDGEIVGIASAGPAEDPAAPHHLQLYVLYTLAAVHGRGAASRLTAAVLGDEPAVLWVADPNPRAQAFYRKQGFAADGAVGDFGGIREIRMVRAAGPVQRDGDTALS